MSHTIHYLVEGHGEPVTLVHGVGANLASWDRVAERLQASFKIIRMDLRGHGQSERIAGSCNLNDFVTDVIAVLDEIGIESTNLVGFSLGGLIARRLALRHPDRVHRLALISTVAQRTPEERRRMLERLATIRDQGIERVVEAAEERWFTPQFREKHPEKVKTRLQELLRNDAASYAEAYRVFATSDTGDEMRDIAHRTLVVTGENDVGSNTRMARFMHEQIKDSELVILPELRHSVLVEAPDIIADLLLHFLGSSSSSKPEDLNC